MNPRRRLLATALLCAWAASAQSQGVRLAGRMGERALLMIDGQTHTLAVGQQAGGVRLLRWQDDSAVLEQGGQAFSLQLGGAPSRLGQGQVNTTARELVLTAGPGGHFIAPGRINGRSVRFMVDTGATYLALGRDEAARLGIDLSGARKGHSQTANGAVAVDLVTLNSVRVGDIELANVGAVVVPAPMPFILLGNSFLSRLQMRRENDVMRLELR